MSLQLSNKIQQEFNSLEEYISYSENVLESVVREAERVRSYGQEIPEYYFQTINNLRAIIQNNKSVLSRCH